MAWNQEIKKEQSKIDSQKEQIEQQKHIQIPKKEIIIWKIDNVNDFIKMGEFINNLDPDTKFKLYFVLEKIDEWDLMDYIDDNWILSSDNIIDDFLQVNISILNDYDKQKIDTNKNNTDDKNISIDSFINIDNIKKQADKVYKEKASFKEEKASFKEENQQKWLELLKTNKAKYEQIFAWDEFVLWKLNELELYKDKPSEIERILKEIFTNEEKTKDFFQKLALSWDKELYEQTYSSFVSISWWENSDLAKKFEEWKIPPFPTPPEYFPTAKAWEVTKRWDIVSYGDASVDLKTGKAYITSENWYKLEAHVDKLDAMPTRIKFQKERLDILEKLETEKTFQKNAENTLKYIKEDKVFDKKKDLEKKLENKKSEKKSPRKSANELQIDLEITQIEKELELVNKKIDEIKKAFPRAPNQTEEDYMESIARFLESKLFSSKQEIEKLEKQLEENKENYEKEISDLLEKNWKAVNDSLEATRETTRFLNLIWFSSLPQEITDKIINNIINTSKRNESQIAELWFVSNLKPGKSDFLWLNWLVWEDIVKQKKAFVKMFNKMMTWETEKPIPTSDSDLLNQEKEISHKYKQEINGILFKEPFEWTWKQGIMEANLFKTNKKETSQTQN